MVRLQPGDLQSRETKNIYRGRSVYLPASGKKHECKTRDEVKRIVDAGPRAQAT